MTIAACYLSAEGVVLGADSTSTMFVAGRGGQIGSEHHYNFAQKIFEVGDPGSTVGVALWGLGSLHNKSHRTLMAEIADEAKNQRPCSLEDLAKLAANMFWQTYEAAFPDHLKRVRELKSKGDSRTEKENQEYWWYRQNLAGGLCLGGRWGTSRQPGAFEILFEPTQEQVPQSKPLTIGNAYFWGCPNLIDRLIRGMDFDMFSRILNSGKWQGDGKDLFSLLEQGALGQPYDLPLREAIDWVHASIYTTIKAMKFSHLEPVCGGPIEIGVISTDRPFRWVCHKDMCQAIVADQTMEERP